MDTIKKQMADDLLKAAEEFLENCPGCSGIEDMSDPPFDFVVDPGDPMLGPVVEPAGCVCRKLRKAAKEYRAYDTVNP